MAAHWTLEATLSCLTSFFCELTCHIPSLPLSAGNNGIPSRPTSSASHGGASPTCPPVEEDLSLPITGEAIHIPNVRGHRSPTAAGSPQARTFDWSLPGPEHPIAVQFQSQELGKAVLGFAVLLTAGLLLNHYQGLTRLQASAIAIALSVGFTATWNGMLLRGICPRAAGALEYFGVVTILVAFFGMVSSFLPPSFKWGCWLCCGLSCLPFLSCLVPLKAIAKEPGGGEQQLGEDMV